MTARSRRTAGTLRSRPCRRALGLAAIASLGLTACDAPRELQPDQALRDSLGLTVRDRVHQVDLIARNGVETAVPALVTVRPGDHVSFRSADGFLHLVRFVADSLDGEGRAWLDAMRVESPPLLDRGARWVVGFERAPSGRYSYTLEGNLRPGRGVVVVDAQSRF